MQKKKSKYMVSIMCSICGLLLASYGLLVGLQSRGLSGFGGIGVIFLLPSIIALIIILLDLAITTGKIKKGLVYSYISTFIKIGIILVFLPSTFHDLQYHMRFGVSNLMFDLILIGSLIIVTIPSIMNITKLSSKNKVKKKSK